MAPQRPEFLTQLQWDTLVAIADGVIPKLTDEEATKILVEHKRAALNPATDAEILAFLQCLPSENTTFLTLIADVFGRRLPERALGELRLLLNIWTSTPGGILLNGTLTPLHAMSPADKEKTILGWYNSKLSPIRTGIRGISHTLRFCWLRSCPEYYRAVGYQTPESPKAAAEGEGDGQVLQARRDLLSRAEMGEFQGESLKTLRTQTLVIGSGSGGSSFVNSFANRLSSHPDLLRGGQTHEILVLDKGSTYLPHPAGKSLGTTEAQGLDGLYENGGVVASEESAISIIAGSTWGGGSRVNWSACLQTDRKVREEWTKGLLDDVGKRKKGGVKDPHGRLFLGKEWQECMDVVERSLNVQTPERADHNPANLTLLEGSRQLGYACKSVPQNISGSFADHARCGANCTIGCRGFLDGEGKKGKMSGCRAFLQPRLKASREGAGGGGSSIRVQGLDGFEIDRIVFSEPNDASGLLGLVPGTANRRAIGAVGTLQDPETGVKEKLLVLADRSVVSAGTLNSPVILLRSGLKNPNIGKNLHLHPTLIVHSRWAEEIDPVHGGILTTAITEFDNLDGLAHGVKIEAMDMMPAFGMAWQPWSGAADYRKRLLGFKHTMGHIVLCREKVTGKIWVDGKTGQRKISYEPSKLDRGHIMQGYLALAKLLYTMGALEICTNTTGGPIWRRSADPNNNLSSSSTSSWADDETFVEFLRATEAHGNELDRTGYGSAHQMGTCRMGSVASKSVVDTRGKVWGTEGLYVADASVFPSASGVNPMVTTMTFGEWIGRRVVEQMVEEAKRGKTERGVHHL